MHHYNRYNKEDKMLTDTLIHQQMTNRCCFFAGISEDCKLNNDNGSGNELAKKPQPKSDELSGRKHKSKKRKRRNSSSSRSSLSTVSNYLVIMKICPTFSLRIHKMYTNTNYISNM